MSYTQSLADMIRDKRVTERFEKMLGDNCGSFLSSILTIANNSSRLRECNPNTILSAAGIAASLKLPVTPSLGFAYIVPYKVHGHYQAQFQIGWKGLVQLAQRSNQYRKLNSSRVYEGQIKEIDFVTGDIIRGEKISDQVVGYVAYMELINGFNKAIYMSVEELKQHAQKYSQSYAYDVKKRSNSSVWSTNFDSMAKKTVLKQLLSKYGIMSIDTRSTDMARALQADQSVIQSDGSYYYVDNERNRNRDGNELIPIEENAEDIGASSENMDFIEFEMEVETEENDIPSSANDESISPVDFSEA